jgi:hypothetical protein
VLIGLGKITIQDYIRYIYLKNLAQFMLYIKEKSTHALKSELMQISATQLQHLNKKPRDGQAPPKVIHKKGV